MEKYIKYEGAYLPTLQEIKKNIETLNNILKARNEAPYVSTIASKQSDSINIQHEVVDFLPKVDINK
jgi:hypothetical protein